MTIVRSYTDHPSRVLVPIAARGSRAKTTKSDDSQLGRPDFNRPGRPREAQCRDNGFIACVQLPA